MIDKRIIFIVAFIPRFILWIAILIRNPGFWDKSFDGYLYLANNILPYSSGTRPPVYPVFIAFNKLFLSNPGVILVQILLSSFICVLTYKLAHKLTHDKVVAFVAGLLVAIDMPSIVLSNFMITETLFTFIFLLAIIHASPVFMGIGILCKPIAMFYPFIVGWQKKSIVYLIICFLVICPWMIRNKMVYDSFSVATSHTSHALLDFTAGNVYAKVHNITRGMAQEIFIQENLSEKARIKKAFKIIVEYPLVFALTTTQGIFHFSKPIRSHIDMQLKTKNMGVVIVVIQLWVMTLLIAPFLRGLRRKQYQLWIIIAYFCLLSAGIVTSARARVPVVPYIAIICASGIVKIKLKERR